MTGAAALEPGDGAHLAGFPGAIEAQLTVGHERLALERAERFQLADDGDVAQGAAAVFAPAHDRAQVVFGQRDQHVNRLGIGGRGGQVDRQADRASAARGHRLEAEDAGVMRGLAHDAASACLVAAVELVASVHDHLRRVESIRAEDLRVRRLAARECLRRERILPPLMVPVVHVERERNDFDVGDRLLAQEPGRAARQPEGSSSIPRT